MVAPPPAAALQVYCHAGVLSVHRCGARQSELGPRHGFIGGGCFLIGSILGTSSVLISENSRSRNRLGVARCCELESCGVEISTRHDCIQHALNLFTIHLFRQSAGFQNELVPLVDHLQFSIHLFRHSAGSENHGGGRKTRLASQRCIVVLLKQTSSICTDFTMFSSQRR